MLKTEERKNTINMKVKHNVKDVKINKGYYYLVDSTRDKAFNLTIQRLKIHKVPNLVKWNDMLSIDHVYKRIANVAFVLESREPHIPNE